MSDTPTPGAPTREQMISAMFASLVMQHTNMAMIFLGLSPNPQTGETAQDLEHARFFIDQLEMLEAKTKGNLDKQEAALLKQSLTHLRMSYVEAVNHPKGAPKTEEKTPAAPPTDEEETPIEEPVLPGEKEAPKTADESKKMFSKKYS